MKAYFTQCHKLNRDIKNRIEQYVVEYGFQLTLRKRALDFSKEEVKERFKNGYNLNIKNIKNADIVIAEGTFRSTGFGFDIATALAEKKPIIYLYSKRFKNDRELQIDNVPTNIIGNKSKYIFIKEYDEYNLKQVLKIAIDDAISVLNTKFNFIIGPELDRYLDWSSKETGLPKSEFIRQKLRDIMLSDKKYQEANR